MKWSGSAAGTILGWNGGDEFATTDLSTRYGHIQTATDWCMNLPVLMAGSEKLDPPKARSLSPAAIDWSDKRSAVSLIGTDGDNVQWYWVIAHAWSYFRKGPGNDENAEDMPQDNAEAGGGVRGYSPVTWCAERLPASIRVVSPEELIWRIRMKHDPSQTERFKRQVR